MNMRWKRLALGAAVLTVAVPATAHAQRVVPIGGNITLTKSGLDAGVETNINRVARRYGAKVGFADVFNNAVQTTKALDGDPVPGALTGFRWGSNNESESDWRPQGITGSADAYASGLAGPYKVLITSWYHRPNPSYARITLHDTTTANAGARYRHVLLVLPTTSGKATLLQSHAGGLAWVGNRLYVASTDRLRVFNVDDIIKVSPARRSEVLTYDYILPQSGEYRALSNPRLAISSVSLERTGTRAQLVTAEFRHDKDGGRILRLPLNKNGLMGASVKPNGAWKTENVSNVQGALIRNDRFALTSSYGNGQPSYLFAGAANTTLQQTTWSRSGAEDLFLVGENNRLYTLTEFEKTRRVFAVDAASVGF
jgi:hypothetical protein